MPTAIVSATCCVLILLTAYFLLTAYSSLLSAISVIYLQLSTFHCLYNTAYLVCQLPAVCYLPMLLLFCLFTNAYVLFPTSYYLLPTVMLAAYSPVNNFTDHLKPPMLCCLRPTPCYLLAITYLCRI